MPILPAAQDWIERVSATLLGIWKAANNGTVLVDPQNDPISYDTLNAVAPLIMAANTGEARFDLSIDPDALTTEVPAGNSVYVDALNGTPGGTPRDAGDPYDTIANGIAAAVALLPSADNRVAVVVRPGIYSETSITIPSWVKLVGSDGAEVTIIEAPEPETVIITGSDNAAVEGLTIAGASGTGGTGVHFGVAGFFLVHRCIISDCETGIATDNADSYILARSSTMSAAAPGLTMETGVYADGGRVDLIDCTVETYFGGPLASGMTSVTADSLILLTNCTVLFAADGVRAESDGVIVVNGGLIVGATNGARATATNGDISLFDVKISSSLAWDILFEGSASKLTLSSTFTDRPKLSLHPNTDVSGIWYSDEPGERAINVEGELRVGSHQRPAESSFGGGDSHVIGMVAKRYDGATWTDVTDEVASNQASEVSVFDGTGTANEFYIGGDEPFPGLKIATTLAAVGGSIAVTYYDGAWQPVIWMTSLADAPYSPFAKALFPAITGHQMRFGPTPGWTTTTLDGVTKYWVRFKVASTLTTIPRIEQMKLHTSRFEVNADGFVEKFGAARVWRQVPIPTNTLEAVGATSPTDQDLWFGTIGAIGLKENAFPPNLDRSIGVGIPIAFEWDTSHKLRVRIKWQASTAAAGTVIWRAVTAIATANSVLTPVSPGPLGDTIVSVTTPTVGVTGREIISEIEVDISLVVTSNRPTFLLMIERQGTVDTYGGDAIIRPGGIELDVLTWADGKPYAA